MGLGKKIFAVETAEGLDVLLENFSAALLEEVYTYQYAFGLSGYAS
jgi:hypothetical protein